MSALSDALAALKNIVLLQERIGVMQQDIARLTGVVDGLNDYTVAIDKRVVRIETMIEVTRGGAAAPQIEN